MTRRALVIGVTGQDGAYLSRLLLDKGYEVVGTHRPSSTINDWRLQELEIAGAITLKPLEMLEFNNLQRLIETHAPDEIYNFAAQSFVQASFEQPIYTSEINAIGVTRVLENIREIDPDIRFYQASTSEMFGNVEESPQDEDSPFVPSSPYAVSKLYGHWMTRNYRQAYDLFAVSGLVFNHESPLRGEHFVTRKVTRGLAELRAGRRDPLELGNLNARRDWGHAEDYVRGIHAMLQQPEPRDYVLATGEPHSVREFVNAAAEVAGFDLTWEGEGLDARGVDREADRTLVRVSEDFYRPADVSSLRGDASRAKEELGWSPSFSFEELVEDMMTRDLERLADEA